MLRESFFSAPKPNRFVPKTLDYAYQIARSVLNIEEDRAKVKETFNLSYTHFMHVFFTKESAYALSHLIFQNVISERNENVDIADKEYMKEFISYFVKRMFPGTPSAQTVGFHYSIAFENLIYDTCACLVARFRLLTPNSKNLSTKLEWLRKCIRIVARLCAATYDYLPYKEDTNNCEWTTLFTILEYAQESALVRVLDEANIHLSSALHFLVLFDEICGHVLENDSEGHPNVRWVACSELLDSVLKRAAESNETQNLKACIQLEEKCDELKLKTRNNKRKRVDDDEVDLVGGSLPETPELTSLDEFGVSHVPSFELL